MATTPADQSGHYAPAPVAAVLLNGEESDAVVSATTILVPARHPGPPLHAHDFDEAFYVLDGELTFQIADSLMTKKAGERCFAPRNTAHALANHSDTDARYLSFAPPPASSAIGHAWPPRRPEPNHRDGRTSRAPTSPCSAPQFPCPGDGPVLVTLRVTIPYWSRSA